MSSINCCCVGVFPMIVASLFCVAHAPRGALGEEVSFTPSQDATLYEYDPADLDSPLNSNGSGDFFSAGRTRSRGLIRRGLIQFDLASIPIDASVTPGSVELSLQVVDAPTRDDSGDPRSFWLLPLEVDWSEGPSEANAGISGAGSGAASVAGDTNWLHTSYDPTIHDPRRPNPSDVGYWPMPGVLGSVPIESVTLGGPDGTVPAAPYLGPVMMGSAAMEADLNRWIADPASNLGWLVLGDESIADPDQSTNRGFASREHPLHPPRLTFQYQRHAVPTGDFDGDGQLTVNDLNLLTLQSIAMTDDARYDITGDGRVNDDDRAAWVHDLKRTYFGDANLDGEFNSGDLVVVFRAGEYEDQRPQNSDWKTGDWDGDLEFDSSDFVLALRLGGYELGPVDGGRLIPEPGAIWLALSAGLGLFLWLRRPRASRDRRLCRRQGLIIATRTAWSQSGQMA